MKLKKVIPALLLASIGLGSCVMYTPFHHHPYHHHARYHGFGRHQYYG